MLRDVSWWFFPAIFVVVVLAASAFARGYFHNKFVPTLIGAAAGVAVLTFAYAAESAILGIIPTWATVQRFGELNQAGVDSIAQQAIRATPELGIVFLISVLLIGAALLVGSLHRVPQARPSCSCRWSSSSASRRSSSPG